jgi:hypothetical protein
MTMACKCAEKVDALLLKQGARLEVTLSTSGLARAIVMTYRDRPRVKLKRLVATFCPFCGKRYRMVKR